MKLIVDENKSNPEEATIAITCREVDTRLGQIIAYIHTQSNNIEVIRDGLKEHIPLDHIFYFESVDSHTYIYTKKEVLELPLKLYELEARLQNTSFLRVSKSCILNLDKLVHVKALMNAKYEGILENEEKIIITRHYVSAFKKKLGV